MLANIYVCNAYNMSISVMIRPSFALRKRTFQQSGVSFDHLSLMIGLIASGTECSFTWNTCCWQ